MIKLLDILKENTNSNIKVGDIVSYKNIGGDEYQSKIIKITGDKVTIKEPEVMGGDEITVDIKDKNLIKINGEEELDERKGKDQDGDGDIDSEDWKISRDKAIKASTQKKKKLNEDHEVSMAQASLKSIIKSSVTLLNKLGNEERNIPGWIQDHITNAENYIDQAAQGFHELKNDE